MVSLRMQYHAPMETAQLAAGLVLDGSYELVAPLGEGGMGEVWRARHLRLPREVAIKVLMASAAASDADMARFRREAEVTSRLGHPNIVEVLDFNTLPDGRAYLVMELLEGEDLRHRIARGPVALADALDIVEQVASALQVAHRAGVIHRDLKPENVFVFDKTVARGTELGVKVLDFGISKMLGDQTHLTQTGKIIGTPAYMSPEQAQGKHDLIDGRTDQFSLATVAYELLGGGVAFGGTTFAEVICKVVLETPPALCEVEPKVPRGISDAIARAMAKEPGQRFGSLGGFVQALRGESDEAMGGGATVEWTAGDAPDGEVAPAGARDAAPRPAGRAPAAEPNVRRAYDEPLAGAFTRSLPP